MGFITEEEVTQRKHSIGVALRADGDYQVVPEEVSQEEQERRKQIAREDAVEYGKKGYSTLLFDTCTVCYRRYGVVSPNCRISHVHDRIREEHRRRGFEVD